MHARNQAFHRATLLLRALWQQGLQHVVISPGSRSTPLTLAAASMDVLKKYVTLDERSAAFTALGIGKATGKPAALICTSGTAVANYFPAVIEARKSGVPLLLLTADRPAHLQHSGANQTIHQQHIFGDYPVFFHQMSETMEPINGVERLAGQAMHHSTTDQGPVHLNMPFQKPLEPDEEFLRITQQENAEFQKQSSIGFPQNQIKSFRFDDDILYEIHASDRPLIIAGQLAAATKLKHIFWLAEWLEAPVLSEQGIIIPKYAIEGFEGFLRNEENLQRLEPDLILRFGREPASKSLLQAIKKWEPERHVHLSDTGEYSDIENTTTDFIDWNGNYFDPGKFPQKKPKWLELWKQIEVSYFKEVEMTIGDQMKLTDGHVYHHFAPQIPHDWDVSFSNSFPARDHSMFGRWNTQKIFTNRGVSGIDGITSIALGVNIGSNKPGILFTGDLAFLHDTNALLNQKELAKPLVIVVINNQGGSIFRMLPIARHESYFKTYFETPQQANIVALAKSYGIHAQKIGCAEELNKINLQSFIAESSSSLHILECRSDAECSMQIRNSLWNLTL